jgi:hypothetical protein
MTQRLGTVRLADADIADDEDRRAFIEVMAGGQLLDEGAVELRQTLEVDLSKVFEVLQVARRSRMVNFFCSRRATSSPISKARKSTKDGWESMAWRLRASR